MRVLAHSFSLVVRWKFRAYLTVSIFQFGNVRENRGAVADWPFDPGESLQEEATGGRRRGEKKKWVKRERSKVDRGERP